MVDQKIKRIKLRSANDVLTWHHMKKKTGGTIPLKGLSYEIDFENVDEN